MAKRPWLFGPTLWSRQRDEIAAIGLGNGADLQGSAEATLNPFGPVKG